jgi:hypothetical protein
MSSQDRFAHIRELLEGSGIPFQASVASDCRRFATVYGDDELHVSSARVSYGELRDANSALREADQCVTLYQELALGESLGDQLQLQMPIECKHRDGLQLFGFEVGDATEYRRPPMVLAGILANSQRFANSFLASGVDELSRPLREIAALVDPSGKNRPQVLKEQFIYKASSALMHFVVMDSRDGANNEVDRVLENLGLIRAFDDYTTKNRYSPMMVAHKWLQPEIPAHADAFAEQYYGGRRLYHMVNFYLPVICADAEIFDASLDIHGKVDTVEPVPLILTSARTPGWPQRLLAEAPTIGPEAIITVTHRKGLQDLLPRLHAWFAGTTEVLLAMDESEVRALLLEAAFMSAVRRRVRGAQTSVNSNLPLDWQQ